MRKQIGFDVVSENIANAQEKQILLGRVQRYLDENDGWEVINTHVPQSGSGALTITVVLGKYKVDEFGYDNPFDSGTEVKRGPGRPKKEEVAVPA